MSVNQSRGDKNEPSQYRRSGRSGNSASPRNFSGGGGGGKGGGGGGSTTAPPSSAFNSGNKSFKKVVSNAQGAQTRVTGPNPNMNLGSSNSSTGGRAAPNGAHMQPPLRGTPDASSTVAPVKPTDSSAQKSPGLPKAPQSNVGPHSSGPTGPATPVKGSGDASRSFPLQFGSISPGVMNGMQVPARTNSAPPNMDEQKRAQAHLESLKAAAFQNPKQHLPRKDVGPGPVDQLRPVDQPNASEARPTSRDKREVLPSAPQISHRPTGPPMPSIQMSGPFHQQPHLHLPFGGPNQPQPMPNTSLPVQLPMHIPIGNPPQVGPQVGPQVFVPGIQHHQGLIHQNQGLTFSGPQMGQHIGNMGMGMGLGLGPQYPQQQQPMGNLNFGGVARRSTVKITHPDTHEELQLEKRADGYPNGGPTGQRVHPHGPPQPQAVQSFPPAHQLNYYPNSYNANPVYYPPPGTQNTPVSQPPRFYNQQPSKQVTVKPAVSSHAEKVNDSSAAAINKSEIPKSQRAGGEGTSGQPNKDSKTTVVTSSAQSENLTVTSVSVEVAKKITVNKPEEEQKQPAVKISGQSSSVSSSTVDHHDPTDSVVEKTSIPSTPVEISNKENVADESATEIITSDNSPKVEGPIVEIVESDEQVKDSVDPNQDTTVSDLTVKEPVNNNDDKSLGSISTPDNVEDVDQVNNQEQPVSVSVSVAETPSLTLEVESTGSISPSSSKLKGNNSNNNNNNNAGKGKKKIKEILKNADARGTTSDLYNAYKRPEEKKETLSEPVENPSVISSEKEVLSLTRERSGPVGPAKFEPDDWEDAADVSGPKMETGLKHHSEDDNDGIMTKKYSRDFLLKFSDQFNNLPEGFEIAPEINEVFVVSGVNTGRDPYPSPGRGGGDRAVSGSRLDRRPSNVGLDDKWNKGSGSGQPVGPGWDPRANHGVLRTPRGQPPGQYTGGILSGPMQSPGPRNNSDSDRWQRATGYQKGGSMPSPHTPMMHKAERKYEVGKITDEEQAKQRQLKGILNKLTPQNFEKLFDQVKQVNIDNANTLSGVIDQIFDKALMEPTFVEMYANFCSRLSAELPDFSENNEKITFKRLLLNKCQEEFERGEREQEEANRTEEEGEVKQTEEEREEKRVKARRRMLGNIRLIGELYKKKMLTERIMHACINKLLGQYQNPDEEDIEALCKLMSTIGEMIDHPKAKEFMDAYFSMMFKLSNNMDLSSRVRFMLKDAIDLRKNKWQQRRKVEGPKKIEEVHRDAANERQAISNRLARGPNSNTPIRRGGQMDFGPKGLQSSPQMGGGGGYNRGPPQQQARGYGNQDSRFDSFENRTLSVPLRPMGDDSITLGPQGGLARGMSVRGQGQGQGQGQPPSMPLHEMDPRRGVMGPNGYGSTPERTGYGPRDDLGPQRFSPRPGFDPNPSNAGRGGPLPERARVSTPPQNTTSSENKVLSEDRLRDMSIEAIKEYYSARDEKEVGLCIKDLNSPSFYPEMISIWVTDSFERKDNDRESLAKLLVNLAKSHDQILTQDSILRGFESVLSTLEDAVNDAPKAAEFLGRIFAKMLLEDVIPYKEAFRLIYEGGEEQGSLVEMGLAAEVLGVILEIIQSEKGDPFLKDLSSYGFVNFRPPSMKKVSRLDKFI